MTRLLELHYPKMKKWLPLLDTLDPALVAHLNIEIWGVDATSGQIMWSKIYGGNQEDKAFGIVESFDNGFTVVGRSYSHGSDRVNWMVKTDSLGNVN